jgi:hypothetical protein
MNFAILIRAGSVNDPTSRRWPSEYVADRCVVGHLLEVWHAEDAKVHNTL